MASESPRQLQTEDDIDDLLSAPLFLLFKHSLICPISKRAFEQYASFVGTLPGTPTAWLDVIGQRALSQVVETRTGLRHASPQALLMSKGDVLWHASHGEITRKSLASAVLEVR